MSLRSLWPYDTVDEASPVISRFSIALLSSILLGMAVGYSLPSAVRTLTGLAGGIGILFYGYRVRLVRRATWMAQEAHRLHTENRLERITTTNPSDSQVPFRRDGKPSSGRPLWSHSQPAAPPPLPDTTRAPPWTGAALHDGLR